MNNVDLKNDWIWSVTCALIGILSTLWNVWIAVILAFVAIFFALSSIKAGSKLGYIGVVLSISIIIQAVISITVWEHVSSIMP